MEAIFREAEHLLQQGDPFVIATVVRIEGSVPQEPGAKLLVRKDGSGVGTVGGGCVEGDIWFAARTILREGGGPQVRDYFLNEESAARDGLICGGTMHFLIEPVVEREPMLTYIREVVQAYQGGSLVALATLLKPSNAGGQVGDKLLVRQDGIVQGSLGEPQRDREAVETAQMMDNGKCRYVTTGDGAELFVESYTAPPSLVVAGGGHISKALAPLAKMLGFRLYIVDDRPEFANRDRFPEAEETVVADYAGGLERLPVSANTAIVVATRGHRHDDLALEAALRTPARYIGMVGSKRKLTLMYEELLKKGIPLERLEEVHAPVGLNIGARSPEEIALSIMAEIVMVRLGGSGTSMKLEREHLLKLKEKVEASSAAT